MKKNLLLSLAITLLFSISALAQTGTTSLTVTIESGEYVEGTIEVPVRLFFDEDVEVGAFDFYIDISDPSVLSVQGATPGPGLPSGLTAPTPDDDPFIVSFASFPATINSSTLTDDNILLYLIFNASSVGTSSLTFLDTNVDAQSAFYSGDGTGTPIISATFNDGLITITSAVPLSMWAFFLMAGLIIAFLAFRAVRLF
jgi:hypothetical protein